MRFRTQYVIVVLASLLFLSQTTVAQQTAESTVVKATVPAVIPFNGIARDAKGQALGGVVGLSFGLYKDQQGGAPLWTEVQNVQVDEQGRYSVLLGATQGGVPTELFAANDARWLAVRVQSAGQEEQPRVLLVSVPYALKAGDADTIGGKPASAFILAQPNGSTAGSDGATSNISAPNGGVAFAASGTGTQNKVAKWTDGSGTLGDSILTDTGSKIGLGNGAPDVALDVSGTIRAVLNPSAPFGTYLMPTGGAANDFRYGFGNNLYFDGTNWRTKGDTVHNAGSALLTDIINGAMSIYAAPSNGGSDQVISNAAFNSLEKMRIQGDGKVGIGNSNPTTALDVAGPIRAVLGPGAPFGTYLIPDDALNGFRFGVGNNLYFDGANWRTKGDGANNGGAGILTSINGSELGIFTLPSNGAADQVISNASFNGFEKLRVSSAGDMGIGTTAPTAKLDVVGNVKSSGTVTGTQLLSTVATGTPPLTVNSTTQVTNLNASLLGGQPAAAFMAANAAALTRGITYLAGCDTCSVLADTDDQKTIYLNVVGAMTINSVTCYSDAGSPIINIQRDDGSPANILSSNLTCTTGGATSTSFVGGETVLNLNDKLDFTMVTAGGTAKRVTLAIKYTLN